MLKMKSLNKTIGWIASFCFMISGAPAAYEAIQTGHSNLNIGTLTLWTVGEIAAILYILPKKDLPLLVNYFVNLVFISIIWYYKL